MSKLNVDPSNHPESQIQIIPHGFNCICCDFHVKKLFKLDSLVEIECSMLLQDCYFPSASISAVWPKNIIPSCWKLPFRKSKVILFCSLFLTLFISLCFLNNFCLLKQSIFNWKKKKKKKITTIRMQFYIRKSEYGIELLPHYFKCDGLILLL